MERNLIRLLSVSCLISILPNSPQAASPSVPDSATSKASAAVSDSLTSGQSIPSLSPEQLERAEQWSRYLRSIVNWKYPSPTEPTVLHTMPMALVDPERLPYMPMKFPDPGVDYKILGLNTPHGKVTLPPKTHDQLKHK